MTTVKVKFRGSNVQGREGVLFFQLIHNRQTRQITSKIRLFKHEWDESSQAIILDKTNIERAVILYMAQSEIETSLKKLAEIIHKCKRQGEYTTIQVVELFTGKSSQAEFFPFMEARIKQLEESGQVRTSQTYRSTLRTLEKFLGHTKLKFENIDNVLMSDFQEHLFARGLTKNTTSFYMRILRTVYKRAVARRIVQDQSPFVNVYAGIDKTQKRAVNEHVIEQLKNFNPKNDKLEFARDIFLWSFYTRGMAFVDIFNLKKENIDRGILTYRRVKTGQQLTIKIEKCMSKIVDTYAEQTKESVYLFPMANLSDKSIYKQYANSLRLLNKRLKLISEILGLEIPLTSYVARHTWASIAKNRGIPLSIISEGMGHTSEITTQIYLASFDRRVIDDANLNIISSKAPKVKRAKAI